MAMGNGGRDERQEASAWVRPEVAAMAGYTPGEQPGERRVIKLNTNENPYPPGAAVRDALAEAAGSLHLYPEPSAAPLRAQAAETWNVDPEGIVAGNGSDELLTILLRAIVAPGQVVAYPSPTYSLYDTLVTIQGARAERVPYGEDWLLPADLDQVDARLFFVCNPNAPSGTAIPRERIETLLHAQPNAVVVVDEAYGDFSEVSSLPLVGRYPNLVVLRTLSKSYSLAGLRVGLAMTTPALAAQLHKVRDSYNLSRPAQAGAIAAMRDAAGFASNRAAILATRGVLQEALRARGFVVPESSANFVLARRPGEELRSLVEALSTRGVLVRWFENLPDCIRVSVGTDPEIEEFLEALDACLAARA